MAPPSNPSDKSAEFEVRYIKLMIDQHNMVANMCDQAVNKASHDSIVMMAQYLSETQKLDMQSMQRMLSNWYGVSYTPFIQPAWQKEMDYISGISGATFEQEFLSFLVVMDCDMVMTAPIAAERAFHKQLVKHAVDGILTSACGIDGLKGMLDDLYGVKSFGMNSQYTQFRSEMISYLITGSSPGTMFRSANR
jgi:uncharacterized protein (DUF305 family)